MVISMTAGQEFVKKIGPFGSILFLLIFVAFLVICFTPPKQAAEETESPPVEESEFYDESPAALEGWMVI